VQVISVSKWVSVKGSLPVYEGYSLFSEESLGLSGTDFQGPAPGEEQPQAPVQAGVTCWRAALRRGTGSAGG